MKRLLGLLLVMVGCGGGKTVDAPKWGERDGLTYEANGETPFTGVRVEKHENGQKKQEATCKDGKLEGLDLWWHANGQKESESIWKDGKEDGPEIYWHANGQKAGEATWQDGVLMSATFWDEEGNKIKADGSAAGP